MIIRLMFLLILLIFLCFHVSIYAYDDKKTHPGLTEKSIKSSNLDDYLLEYVGIAQGIMKTYNRGQWGRP